MKDFIQETKNFVAKEDVFLKKELNYLEQILAIAEGVKSRDINDESTLKSVRRKIKNLVRKAGRIDKKIEHFKERVIVHLKELISFLPLKYAEQFRDKNFILDISDSADIIYAHLCGHKRNVSDITNKSNVNHDFLTETINKILDEGVRPLSAVLSGVSDFLEDNKTRIYEEIKGRSQFIVDIDGFLNALRLPVRKAVILFDSDFLKTVHENRLKSGIKDPNYVFKLYPKRLVLTTSVEDEITAMFGGHALIDHILVNYIRKISDKEQVIPTRQEILQICMPAASSEKCISEKEKGDLSILTYVLRNPATFFILLSNDTGIIKYVQLMHRFGRRNVKVVSYSHGSLKLST